MAPNTLLRADRYHTGPWPYAHSDGVGLALSGYPTDVHAFIDALHAVSCPPVAVRRILAELQAGRTKYTTVRNGLDFNTIGADLAAVGVTMKIIPPGEPGDPRYDHAALVLVLGQDIDMSEFSAEERHIIDERVQHTQASLAQIPHDFGAFV